jgi:hypothetical protein
MFEVGGVPLSVAKRRYVLQLKSFQLKTKFVVARDFEA